jgi:hypothetical protein
MPTSGLEKLEKVVGLPDFSDSLAEEDYLGNQSTHFQEHFASQIVLRRLMIELHTDMSQGQYRRSLPTSRSNTSNSVPTYRPITAIITTNG